MKFEQITVTGIKLEIHPGKKIQISKEQAGIRAHNLKKIGGDVYEVLKPIEFKRGEEIGIVVADISKADRVIVKVAGKKGIEQETKMEEKKQDTGEAGDGEAKNTDVIDLNG